VFKQNGLASQVTLPKPVSKIDVSSPCPRPAPPAPQQLTSTLPCFRRMGCQLSPR
jgi:hypothetical protein